MTRLHLSLYREARVELDEIEFLHPLLGTSILSVRGKSTSGRFADASFQWTVALQALTVLLLKNAAHDTSFLLRGFQGSAAASLDFAISKQPRWVVEVFGADKDGKSLLRRIVRRANSNLKRPGPVEIGLSSTALPPGAVTLSVNNKDLTDPREIDELANALIRELWGEEAQSFEPHERRLLAA